MDLAMISGQDDLTIERFRVRIAELKLKIAQYGDGRLRGFEVDAHGKQIDGTTALPDGWLADIESYESCIRYMQKRAETKLKNQMGNTR